jgi:xanthine dehydrogenase accessory factor
MEVLVEAIPPAASPGGAWVDTLQQHRHGKRPAVSTVRLDDARREVFVPGGEADESRDARDQAVTEAAREALRTDDCRLVGAAGARTLVQPFNPPLRLIVVGAVHIAQPLAKIAAQCGFEVVVVDPRGAFATEARFPGVTLSRAWPDEALEALAIDTRSAVVTLTHDPKLDDPALAVALRSPAFYVGCLGSRRTQARRLERMRDLGLDDDALARIHGPVGLDIGARSPAEIAVSILAEITERLRA